MLAGPIADVVAFTNGAIQSLLLLPLIGILAGTFGGMLGVGGGLIMIPMLVLILGRPFGQDSLHVYKLASLISSVLLSLPAARRHAQLRALHFGIIGAYLPAALVGVALGTFASSLLTRELTPVLQRIFGAFLLFVVAYSALRDFGPAALQAVRASACPMPSRRLLLGACVGLPAGIMAGLLGVGGGIWAVPVQHQLFGIRLQNAIANSTAMIVGVAAAAALAQGVAVSRLPDVSVSSGAWLALWLAPGAILGGPIGAWLTHRMHTFWLRQAFHVVLTISAFELLRK
ncbi:MAG: sulfite exporter TauE/SafE family protein [Phycisphaerae bacterium]